MSTPIADVCLNILYKTEGRGMEEILHLAIQKPTAGFCTTGILELTFGRSSTQENRLSGSNMTDVGQTCTGMVN